MIRWKDKDEVFSIQYTYNLMRVKHSLVSWRHLVRKDRIPKCSFTLWAQQFSVVFPLKVKFRNGVLF